MKACDDCQIIEWDVLPPQFNCIKCLKIYEDRILELKAHNKEMGKDLMYACGVALGEIKDDYIFTSHPAQRPTIRNVEYIKRKWWDSAMNDKG